MATCVRKELTQSPNPHSSCHLPSLDETKKELNSSHANCALIKAKLNKVDALLYESFFTFEHFATEHGAQSCEFKP